MHIKQIDLTRFKSFGSSTTIPVLPGFTVISGPNGSGKSNILDALLFALGLSSSRGMRAEKLLDLVHTGSLENGRRRVETSVSVTFALDGGGRSDSWKVTRRLRVSGDRSDSGDGPTSTSTFYINDVPCTLSDLHEQLEAMHIYPNGYNVVLQGDVTGIISMNAKERRQIIDELAGVATFDRKIAQANTKLEAVREQIERFRLIEAELQVQSERLLQERDKAQQYQQLRIQLEQVEQWQRILTWRHLQNQAEQIQAAIAEHLQQQVEAAAQLEGLSAQLALEEATLAELQSRIHALGEDEYLSMQAQLATRQAQLQQQQQQIAAWTSEIVTLQERDQQALRELEHWDVEYARLQGSQQDLGYEIEDLLAQQRQAQTSLQISRDQQQALAQSSDAWVKQQRYLTQQLEQTRQEHAPLQQEQIRLGERLHQLERQAQEAAQEIATLQPIGSADEPLQAALQQAEARVQDLAHEYAQIQATLEVDRATCQRLQAEMHAKQRQLDKLETRQQVLSEGSRPAQIVLNAKLLGVCGLVAQLGQVDPRYQLALEIAAGNRLNFIVVEDETIATTAINLLKREKAGRATFLPLSKLQALRPPAPLKQPGLIDYAIRLVKFDDRFRDVFGFVFGQTLIFESLQLAQPHVGRYRIVTLEGDLLETSGAMTGGTVPQRSGIHFGPTESSEAEGLRQRLADIEDLLSSLTPRIATAQAREKFLAQDLVAARQQAHLAQQACDRHHNALSSRQARLDHLQQALAQYESEREQSQLRLGQVQDHLAPLAHRIADLSAKLQQLEHSPVNQHWQQAQAAIQQQEVQAQTLLDRIRQLEGQQQALETSLQLNRGRYQQQQERQQEWQERRQHLQVQIGSEHEQIAAQQAQIAALQAEMAEAEFRMADLRQERDQQEFRVRTVAQQIQRLEWERYNAATQQQEKEAQLAQIAAQSAEAQAQLPDPFPPPLSEREPSLDELARLRRRTEDKLRALEPVNMLAITEYQETQARLADLSQKLTTLQQERTELLLRIENFATLRKQAFMDAFSAVDLHFRQIFAQLSEGDGHLALENPADPLAGGLTLVAHPKGKPVRHLSSMSGGEKSLTALSFIFALQRFRPSSFYAFDEVDMFLDGANVEKLAAMIWQQAQQAQFIVVSLRRPMIEKADRTIGVTQARGSSTQVIGLSAR